MGRHERWGVNPAHMRSPHGIPHGHGPLFQRWPRLSQAAERGRPGRVGLSRQIPTDRPGGF
eukprot:scaffold133290_cov79-Phaeocystis_antarctica.AAC.1